LPSTLGDYVPRILTGHWHKLLNYRDQVLADGQTESLHQLRVTVRRLRAGLDLFGLALEIPKQGRSKKLQRLGSALGEQRDLDVMMKTLAEIYRPQVPDGEQIWIDHLTRDLGKHYPKARRHSHKLLQSKGFDKIYLTWQAWIDAPTYSPKESYPLAQSLPLLLLPALRDVLLHPGWHLELPPCQDPEFVNSVEPLHTLRKALKRLRYQLEECRSFYPASLKTWIQDLKDLQDHLGQINDDQVMRTQLADLLPHDVTLLQVETLGTLLREEAIALGSKPEATTKIPNFSPLPLSTAIGSLAQCPGLAQCGLTAHQPVAIDR
ncbi:MAG: CHAD domain-containing protein, partial [Synechococcaceae cyanobacterium RM1_1_27]|nr:CHAD domain-containing protein [Synechococcaceae cyanobacterium RM1_1_27]